MKKNLNLNELVWFLILIGFTCYFYMVISTDKITLFVHPKMVKYVSFALYFFMVLVVFQVKNIFSSQKVKSLKFGYIMFLIPLALGVLLKAEGVSTHSVISKGFSLTSQLKINTLKHKHITLVDGTEVCEHDEEYSHPANHEDASLDGNLESLALKEAKIIDMSNEEFLKNYENIYGNPHNYVGRVINMKGFIYKQEGLSKNEFILSRILISCCAADAQLVGLLCDYSEAMVFAEGAWINIVGTLAEGEYEDYKSGEVSIIPVIKVSKIEEINKQDNEYIYN